MRIEAIILAAAGALASASLVSCNTDPLCMPQPPQNGAGAQRGRQRIAYDWKLDPQASPQGMRLWLYPLDWVSEATPVDIPGREGGEVSITPGRYRLISYNNDTEWIVADNAGDFPSHRLRTRDAGVLDPLGLGNMSARGVSACGVSARGAAIGPGDERVAAAPEPVWAVTDPERGIADGDTIRLSPQPLHCHYTFRFINLQNLSTVARASATISGMSPGVNLTDMSGLAGSCTHPLSATVDVAHGEIYGDFYTFGPADPAVSPSIANRMALYVVLGDGTGYKMTRGDYLDVTAQIRSARDPRNVDIIIDGVNIPSPQAAAGDFHVDVDDWGDGGSTDLPI